MISTRTHAPDDYDRRNTAEIDVDWLERHDKLINEAIDTLMRQLEDNRQRRLARQWDVDELLKDTEGSLDRAISLLTRANIPW